MRVAAAVLVAGSLACASPVAMVNAPCSDAPIPPDAPSADRLVPGTRVVTCADGEHREDWPAGGAAVRGARRGGLREGVWTLSAPDGSRDGEIEYAAGVPVRRTLRTTGGRRIELELEQGRVVGFRAVGE